MPQPISSASFITQQSIEGADEALHLLELMTITGTNQERQVLLPPPQCRVGAGVGGQLVVVDRAMEIWAPVSSERPFSTMLTKTSLPTHPALSTAFDQLYYSCAVLIKHFLTH